MRRIALFLVVSIGLTGCGPDDKKVGEAKDKRKNAAKAAFSLSGPADPVEILNGKEATLNVKLVWATNAKEELDLTVTVSPADRGVTAKVEPARLKREDEQAAVTVTVGEAAASGDYKVKLLARTATAAEAAWEGTVRVPKKE